MCVASQVRADRRIEPPSANAVALPSAVDRCVRLDKLREQFLPSPDQRLETEINLLQDRARANPKELAAAERQAEFVLSQEDDLHEENWPVAHADCARNDR